MLTNGIEEINRKQVDWVDDGGYKEPYLILQIGDVELLETIIQAIKQADRQYGEDIEVEFRELTDLRTKKRREFGDLEVPSYVQEYITKELKENFTSYDADRPCDEDDVIEAYESYSADDDDLPFDIPDEMIREIVKEVNEYVEEQRELAENDEWIREASYRW